MARPRVMVEMVKLKNLHSGLGSYCFHLGKCFSEQESELDLGCYVPASMEGLFGNSVEYALHRPYHKLYLPVERSIGLWHGTHQECKYWPSDRKIIRVITVHDLNFMIKYEGAKRERHRNKLQARIDSVDSIITISEFTKKGLLDNIEVKGKPLHVIHNGGCIEESEASSSPEIELPTEYLFTVGIISRKKNFHVLVPMLQSLPELHLVVAGSQPDGYGQEIIDLARELGLGERVHLIGNVTEAEKKYLYEHCRALVFPSLQEGFGLPVIEAMSLGKPTFLSDRTSLPEVGGPLACYWESFDPVEMAAVLRQGLTAYDRDPGMAQRIREYARHFSWRRAATEYLRMYRELLP